MVSIKAATPLKFPPTTTSLWLSLDTMSLKHKHTLRSIIMISESCFLSQGAATYAILERLFQGAPSRAIGMELCLRSFRSR